MKTVLILGATGLVGQNLVRACCASSLVGTIKIFVRKNLSESEKVKLFGACKKLETVVVDFESLTSSAEHIKGDLVLSALGTTIKVAKSKENFFRIDHDYNLNFAKLAKQNGVPAFGIVSSVGASQKASSFYLKTKGQIENDLAALHFKKFVAVRPSFLIGERGEHRLGEKIGIGVFSSLRPLMFGGLKKYSPIPALEVALTLVDLCLTEREFKTGLDYERKVMKG